MDEVTRDGPEWERAQNVALRYLATQPRTVAQIRARLARAQVSEPVVDSVVAWLAEYGYVNDEAFAQGWVRSRGSRKRLSSRALADELRRQGIPRDVAAEALSGEPVDADEERARLFALAALERLARRGVPVEVAVRRVQAALMRRGFPASTASAACRAAQQELAGAQSVS